MFFFFFKFNILDGEKYNYQRLWFKEARAGPEQNTLLKFLKSKNQNPLLSGLKCAPLFLSVLLYKNGGSCA